MSVQIVIVAHEARAPEANELARTLDAIVCMDDGTLGTYGNHRAALLAGAATGASHVCVLEDDAVPVDRFTEHVQRAAEAMPNELVGLYVGQSRPRAELIDRAVRRADEVGASWLHSINLLWGVGYLAPTSAIPSLVAASDIRTASRYADTRIGQAWRSSQGRPIYYTWPSLVDHADGPSITNEHEPRGPGRVAHRVGVPNWSDKVVETRT